MGFMIFSKIGSRASLFVVLTVFIFTCSCSSNNEPGPVKGITSYNWDISKAQQVYTGKTFTLKFVADGKWVAASSQSWLKLLTSAGVAGDALLQVVPVSNAPATRECELTITVGTDKVLVKFYQEPSSTALKDINVALYEDKYLRENYLWNEEYISMEKSFAETYDKYLSNQLLAMKTNVYDQRVSSSGSRYTFSYITKKASLKSARVQKEPELSAGFTGLIPVHYQVSGIYTFWVCGVYPDSPADKAGIRRGTVIRSVNGENISERNINDKYYELLHPEEAGSLKLTDYDHNEIDLAVEALYLNPVIHKEIKNVDSHKIGYLVYRSFEASFDEELFEVFKEFNAQGVTDMVLDLRYNGGGHVISANLISSCIAGAACRGKVFTRMRYNDTRMKSLSESDCIDKFYYDNYSNLNNTSLAAGALNLTKVYCLVGSATASASELVINSLRGIDVNVVLIGEQTVGKNVGMEVDEKTVDGADYVFAPITFQSYNAKDFGDYSSGFAPDYTIDEFGSTGLKPFGSYEEPLFAKAVELIAGHVPVDASPVTKSYGEFGMAVKLNVAENPAKENPLQRNMFVYGTRTAADSSTEL